MSTSFFDDGFGFDEPDFNVDENVGDSAEAAFAGASEGWGEANGEEFFPAFDPNIPKKKEKNNHKRSDSESKPLSSTIEKEDSSVDISKATDDTEISSAMHESSEEDQNQKTQGTELEDQNHDHNLPEDKDQGKNPPVSESEEDRDQESSSEEEQESSSEEEQESSSEEEQEQDQEQETDSDEEQEKFAAFSPNATKDDGKAMAKVGEDNGTNTEERDKNEKRRAQRSSLQHNRPGAYGVSAATPKVAKRDMTRSGGVGGMASAKERARRPAQMKGEIRPGAFGVSDATPKAAKRDVTRSRNEDSMAKERARRPAQMKGEIRPGAFGVSDATPKTAKRDVTRSRASADSMAKERARRPSHMQGEVRPGAFGVSDATPKTAKRDMTARARGGDGGGMASAKERARRPSHMQGEVRPGAFGVSDATPKTAKRDATRSRASADNMAKERARRQAQMQGEMRPGAFGVSDATPKTAKRDVTRSRASADNMAKERARRPAQMQGEMRPGAFGVSDATPKTAKRDVTRTRSGDGMASAKERARRPSHMQGELRPGAFGVSEMPAPARLKMATSDSNFDGTEPLKSEQQSADPKKREKEAKMRARRNSRTPAVPGAFSEASEGGDKRIESKLRSNNRNSIASRRNQDVIPEGGAPNQYDGSRLSRRATGHSIGMSRQFSRTSVTTDVTGPSNIEDPEEFAEECDEDIEDYDGTGHSGNSRCRIGQEILTHSHEDSCDELSFYDSGEINGTVHSNDSFNSSYSITDMERATSGETGVTHVTHVTGGEVDPRILAKIDSLENPTIISPDEAVLMLEEPKTSIWARHKWKFIAFFFVVVAGAVGGAVALLSGGGGNASEVPTEQEEDNTALDIDEIVSWEHLVQVCDRKDAIDSMLLQEGVLVRAEEITSQLGLESIKQSRRLMTSSEFLLDCSAQSLSVLAMALLPASVEITHQRYILSVFFFESRGIEWEQNNLWLNDTAPCDGWFGIDCSVDSTITSLVLNALPEGGEIASELFRLASLTDLRLEGQMGGTLPSLMTALTNLENLDISGKMLMGTMPSDLNELTELTALRIFGQRISGTLPSDLKLEKLRQLTLSSNALTSTIPAEFGSLNLTFLQLGGEIRGRVPDSVWFHPTLKVLDLGETQLSDELVFGAKTDWEAIVIGIGNNYIGKFPSEIGMLTELREFVVRNNALTGTIPTEVGLCTSLRAFDIAGNDLTGALPTELGNLRLLRRLMIASNFISGTIPEELATIEGLEEFWGYGKTGCEGADNVFGPRGFGLTGTIPPGLCALENLTDLVFTCRSDILDTCPQGCPCSCF